jgi:hypothetical protein
MAAAAAVGCATLATLAAAAAPAQALPELCIDAARTAAARHGIPAEVMQAITLVETGRWVDGAGRPWPWTLNIGGEGHWFETRDAALARAVAELARGRASIDIGCFQLNWHWHGGNFRTPDEMLDPLRAADYAARFLARLHAETGDWRRAAGLYHSRTPGHAQRYRALIDQALAALGAPPPQPLPVPRRAADPAGGAPLIVLASAATPGAAAAPPGGVALRLFTRPAGPWFTPGTARP